MTASAEFDLHEVESIQVSLGPGLPPEALGHPQGVAIGWISVE